MVSITPMQGAIVAMDPSTGAILAQATWPGYDPSIWVPPYKGQNAVLAAANRANKDKSLPSPLNDLTSAPFPPGSTFKPFTAAAAWRAGLIAPGSQRECSTTYVEPVTHDSAGHVWHNWGPGSGMIDLPTALTISCDTFFYRLGDEFYGLYQAHPKQQPFQSELHRFGYGRVPTGYDLLTSSGTVPTPYWKKHDFACGKPGPKAKGYINHCGLRVTPQDAQIQQAWDPGDDVQMAIGQGFLTVTPLQEAVAYSALANGGKVVRPHVVSEILDPANNNAVVRRMSTAPVRNLNLSPEYLAEVEQGLHGATHDSQGTSSAIFGSYTGQPFDVWGKTGTAETGVKPRRIAEAQRRMVVGLGVERQEVDRGRRHDPERRSRRRVGRAGRAAGVPVVLRAEGDQRRPILHRRREPLMQAYFRHLDYVMLAAVASICAFGLWVLQNATRNDPGSLFAHQLIYMIVGWIVLLVIAAFPTHLLRRFSWPLYGFVIATTGVVLALGTTVQGGTRWIAAGAVPVSAVRVRKALRDRRSGVASGSPAGSRLARCG